MGQKCGKLIAILLAVLLLVGLFPTNLMTSAEAEESSGDAMVDSGETNENTTGTTSRETESAGEEDAEWADTGKLNADGTPVTAQQGDTTGNSGAVTSSDTSVLSEGTPDSYTLTLELNGGQVNGLQGAGWTRSSASSYTWVYTVTAGDSLTLNDTLGGLLPSEPYREGYRFLGWDVDGSPATGESTVQVATDTTVTARWEVTEYTVTFRDGSAEEPLWTVKVPYDATLWTDQNETPWTSVEENGWTPVDDQTDQWTAKVDIALGSTRHENVEVTRHLTSTEGETPTRYYYSFRIDGLYYFTYGGTEPTKTGYSFTGWRMTAGGTGFAVTRDATFTARFQAGATYIINVYYYYSDGSRVEDITTQTLTYSAQQVVNNTITFHLTAKEKEFYAWKLNGAEGVSQSGNEVTVDVEQAYADSAGSTTRFLALTVVYSPVEITYTVEYYQQNVGAGTDQATDYQQVGTTSAQTAPYGSLVTVTDRPALDGGVSFDGFEASSVSQSALHSGVLLETGTTNVEFQADKKSATIQIYYDRASYFIYFQTGTSEVYLDPVKIQYGGEMPKLEDNIDKLHRTGYKAVTTDDISWMYLDENGKLSEVPQGQQNGTMPAYDVYAVFHWVPDTTSIQIVYWVESRNSASFQNAYIQQVDNVTTEAELTVNLTGKSMTISGGNITDDGSLVSSGFQKLIEQRYGNVQYTTFFGYSPDNTRTSPGNVANAQATDSGQVADGAITGDQFQVKVNGDGSTTINVYYTRNLYTLEFVLARDNSNRIQVATNTPGTFAGSGWTDAGSAGGLSFADFPEDEVNQSQETGKYGGLNYSKVYRLADALNDDRAPVGRYGTKTINGYNCYVYTLTARFEAEISVLWPIYANLGSLGSLNYVSMGSDSESFYRKENKTGNANVLGAYATMDQNIVAKGDKNSWTAKNDSGNGGDVAHQLVAYWSKEIYQYQYYFLYETLDTTISQNSDEVEEFSAKDADAGNVYDDGDLVSYRGKVYVYDSQAKIQQNSSNTRGAQNQPAKQGFISEGKLFYGEGNVKEDSNIYFFYTRETYNLSIQNINGEYSIPEDILNQKFDCLSNYVADTKTLAELGWFWNKTQDTIYVRYGGYLAPLGESEIIQWLTSENGGNMEYPIPTSGENQYYFSHWYRNAGQTVLVDWTDNDLRTIKSNVTLYAGWFTPRFTTTYVLNGGSWVDADDNQIRYTLIAYTDDKQQNAFFYYPHQTEEEGGNATLYWYLQSQPSDRLYVDNLYTCKVSDVLQWDADTQHWAVKDGLDLEALREHSTLDTTGTRLVDAYYCYMGEDGQDSTYNHEGYVNINSALNTVLEEPQAPIRNGYTFSGWFYFDALTGSEADKTYLADVLGENQSLSSYRENYVYLNSVGDAFLLHQDDQGLYYYPSQTGYRFSYENDASVVSHTRMLYAAWTPTSDAEAVVYHLVEKEDVPQDGTFTPKGGSTITVGDQTQTITIGSTEYYVLKTEQRKELYTGSTVSLSAWEYCADDKSQKWLPQQASIQLRIDDSTQTVENAQEAAGNTYRIQQPDGSYTYYACFVYEATEDLTYNVYAIDLAVAVAEGALTDFQDTFDRADPPPENAYYVLRVDNKTWDSKNPNTLVQENAPAISGYTIYEDWTQTLQMQTQQGTNNLYFYYVQDGSFISYDVTYYLKTDGSYSDANKVTFTHVPGVRGEVVSLTKLLDTYQRMITQAQVYSDYDGSGDEEARRLYDRYKDMTVTLTQNGQSESFTVKTGDTDALDLTVLAELGKDYYLESWSPTGDSLVLSDKVNIDVYLGMAELVVQKVNADGEPLGGATFTLQRLRPKQDGDVGETILLDEKQYVVDDTFQAVSATSGSDGKARFQNLSARTDQDDSGYRYRLVETAAPAGYNRLSEPVYVTTPYTVNGTTSYSVTYTVVNSGISYLPNAGVFGGVYTTMLLGGALMAAALTGYVVLTARRRPGKFRGDGK